MVEESGESFQAAVGKFLASYRAEHDITLDEIARHAREFGASWGTQSVRNIQTGSAAPTVPNLITLALALGSITGEPLTLRDLLGTAVAFEPPTALGLPFSRKWIDGVLSGDSIAVGDVTKALVGGSEKRDETLKQAPAVIAGLFETLKTDYPSAIDWSNLVDLSRSRRPNPTLAETRAAERLGIEPAAVAVWAQHLWSSTLEDEARRRAGHDASAQRRGAATRGLVKEIELHLRNQRVDG